MASVIDRPWWRSNHGATVAEMPGGRERRPADADQHEAGIELPRRADLADQCNAGGDRDGADRQHRARPQRSMLRPTSALHDGAHQEEQRDRRGDLGHRPAVLARHGLQVDAGAEQAEPPAERGDDEADGDDAPAVEEAVSALSARTRG